MVSRTGTMSASSQMHQHRSSMLGTLGMVLAVGSGSSGVTGSVKKVEDSGCPVLVGSQELFLKLGLPMVL